MLQILYGALPGRRQPMARPLRRLWCGCHGVSPRNNTDSFHPTYLFQRLLLLRQLPQQLQLRRISVFLHHDTGRHMVPLRSLLTNRVRQQSFGSTSGKNTIRSKDDHSSNTNKENHINRSLKENYTDNDSHLQSNLFQSPRQNVKVKTVENTKNNVNANDATTVGQATTSSNTDAINGPYLMERFIPKSYRPYAYLARLDKPIGTMLLVRVCIYIRVAFAFYIYSVWTFSHTYHCGTFVLFISKVLALCLEYWIGNHTLLDHHHHHHHFSTEYQPATPISGSKYQHYHDASIVYCIIIWNWCHCDAWCGLYRE
jgi:hypothetical protein